jgi:hypothetical protein
MILNPIPLLVSNPRKYNNKFEYYFFLIALSLEDLVKSFDNTINSCFSDRQIIESSTPSQTDLITTSKFVSIFSRFLFIILILNSTWSDLIEHLHTSLRKDLKLPSIANNCQKAMNSIYEKKVPENDFLSIDDLNDEEEDELREKLDMHSVIVSTNNLTHEPFLTAEQVISEIDFMLQDMTPDSGYCDDLVPSRKINMKKQTIYSLNELNEELNRSIKDLSSILVQELALRDELEDEKETKNTFISLVHNIQVRN